MWGQGDYRTRLRSRQVRAFKHIYALLRIFNPRLLKRSEAAKHLKSYDLAGHNPEIVAQIRARIENLLPTFPDQVRADWQDTMRTQVDSTPEGALPVRRNP